MPGSVLLIAVVAGLLASLACGLGVLPLLIPGLDPRKHIGVGYALAGGLMFSASVYNLIFEGIELKGGDTDLFAFANVWPVILGVLIGAMFLSVTERLVHGSEHTKDDPGHGMARWGGRTGLLVFIAMTIHSIPEGIAVGTGFAAQEHPHFSGSAEGLGYYIALAIAIHNIPEGLAVAIPMRSAGASMWRCFWAAVITSLPQPIAAIPAVLLAWFFQPLMPGLLGFAAGAMIFLVIVELIPEALETEKPGRIAWAFVIGFCLMLLIQVLL